MKRRVGCSSSSYCNPAIGAMSSCKCHLAGLEREREAHYFSSLVVVAVVSPPIARPTTNITTCYRVFVPLKQRAKMKRRRKRTTKMKMEMKNPARAHKFAPTSSHILLNALHHPPPPTSARAAPPLALYWPWFEERFWSALPSRPCRRPH